MPFRSYIKTHHPKAFSILKNLRSFISSIMTDQNNPNTSADPPPFNPLKPALPISYPLKTLQELDSRVYFNSFHFPFNQSTVKLPPAALPQRPRTLVCHDMAGGYTDDNFVQGGKNAEAYAIWHWYLIDIFVYFSHNLVTLPPPSWTNTAHRHGVKVLGTFIMEWDEGKALADILLSTKASAQLYAERLSELAVSLGFDGWLINLEVKLEPGQIPNLQEFVNHLSQTMHSALPGSLVIWYDSVTIDGKLDWQNQLNDKNKAFFDICDGLFCNYTWKKDFPKLSADVAGERKYDVYMGIDVFGRGTFGGGQWTTNVALDVIKKNDVSAAIFAPGWIYETNQLPDFQTAQNRWWGLVEKSWGTVQNYPKALPFYSNFNAGHGYHTYIDGVQVSDTTWNNLSLQSFQPCIEYPGEETTQPIQVSLNFKEASFNGGSNITFTGTLAHDADFKVRLFKGELIFGKSPIHFVYSVRSSGNSLLGIALDFSSPKEEKKSVFLASPGDTLLTMTRFSTHFTHIIMPRRVTKVEQKSGWVLLETNFDMADHTLTEIRAVCYRLKAASRAPSQYDAVLGDIKITTTPQISSLPLSSSWTLDSQFVVWASGPQGSKCLSAEISWQLKDGNTDFLKYNLYVSKIVGTTSGEGALEYIGEAVVKSFYVSDLEVGDGVTSLKFVIQVCDVGGYLQNLEDSPSYLLNVE